MYEPLLIKNATICDHQKHLVSDVLIENGLISAIEEEINMDCRIVDAKNLCLMPAFTDLHAHFRDPGFTHKEDIMSGSMAAIKGGYTTVNLMANTNPICNNGTQVEANVIKAKKAGLVDIFQACSVTKNFDGTDVSHLKEIHNERCKVISDDGFGVESDEAMKNAMVIAREKGLIVSSHAEYSDVSSIDTRNSENFMTRRDIKLCESTKAHLHMAHVSTKEAVEMIRMAKKDEIEVTCECTPHHISLTDDIDYIVHPPLRKREDVRALIGGLKDGTIDCIATDHAPHTKTDKANGARGISSIEIAFSICFTYLVKTGKITLQRLSELMSYTPSNFLGINKGELKTGKIADVVLIDLKRAFVVDSLNFTSKGKNTPFNSKKLYSMVLMTIKDGFIKYDNGRFYGGDTHG